MTTKKCTIHTLLIIYFLCTHLHSAIKQPKLTIIVIVDQFAHHYLPKIQKHFQYGIQEILDHGTVYKNAYHPHGIPETTPGHNSFSTGVLPKDHTATSNKWFTQTGKKVFYEESLSPKHTKVDGISDQFIMSNQTDHKVFSFSTKATAAIATANKLGKAIWFDPEFGGFRSSKTYYDKLPSWIKRFNKNKRLKAPPQIKWKSFYDKTDNAYNFPFINDYDNAAYSYSLVNNSNIPQDANKYDLYVRTPKSAQDIMDLAQSCLLNNLSKKGTDRMILWLCISNLDLVGHMYGPDSLECIDTLYHLDKQLMGLMQFTRRRYGANNVLFILSSDHGVQPIQEIMVKKGISTARRISAKKLINKMNTSIEEKYDISDAIQSFASTYFVLNSQNLKDFSPKQQHNILLHAKSILEQTPGIKKVWTYNELASTTYKFSDLEHFYKNHLHHNRKTDLICMPEPYCLITDYPTGCSHNTPYEYDTHVPLALYSKGAIQHKTINQKVWIPQVATTLSHLYNINKPSNTTFPELPGIFT